MLVFFLTKPKRKINNHLKKIIKKNLFILVFKKNEFLLSINKEYEIYFCLCQYR